MPWDTGTSSGSIMNPGSPSIRLVPLNKHASVCRDNVGIIELYNKAKKRELIFVFLHRSLESLVVCRTSRLSFLIGR